MFSRILVSMCACILTAACGSGTDDAATSSDAGSVQTGDSGGDAADCDPRGTVSHDDSGTTDASSGADGSVIIVGDGGNIALDSGSDPPFGYLKCFDPETGAGFECSQYQMICCDKKDDCYDPAKDPGFCDRPWCPTP